MRSGSGPRGGRAGRSWREGRRRDRPGADGARSAVDPGSAAGTSAPPPVAGRLARLPPRAVAARPAAFAIEIPSGQHARKCKVATAPDPAPASIAAGATDGQPAVSGASRLHSSVGLLFLRGDKLYVYQHRVGRGREEHPPTWMPLTRTLISVGRNRCGPSEFVWMPTFGSPPRSDLISSIPGDGVRRP